LPTVEDYAIGLAGGKTGVGDDQFFPQIERILSQANLQTSAINNLINELQKNLVVKGEVISIQNIPEVQRRIVHVSPIGEKLFLAFRFPEPNKDDALLSEFQCAQNYGHKVRVTYIVDQNKNFLIKSIEVIPWQTFQGKK
jgi:hypothetical protein